MLICHVRKPACRSKPCRTCNRRPRTNTPQKTSIVVTVVIISTIAIEKPAVVIATLVRMTYAPAAHPIRNQSAQDFLCVEHAPHVCRSPGCFASVESCPSRLARSASLRYRGAVIKSSNERADVVIVGAGVIGASVAYHLAKRGAGSILVVEKESAPGRGSTGRATGGYRAQYSSDINVRLSLIARDSLRRFSEETGVDPGYRPVGYLWIASTPDEYDDLVQARTIQRNAGLDDAQLLDPNQVVEKNPFVQRAGIIGGAFCQTDGFIRPLDILHGYMEASQRLGARFVFNTNICGFERTSEGRIHTVITENGSTIETQAVIDAGGAWACDIARLAGFDLPVVPLRRQVALTEPCNRLPDDMPLSIFMSDGFHLRVRDGRVMLLRPTPGHPEDPYDTRVEKAWLEEIIQIAKQRIPCLTDVRIDANLCWAGLYEMSPDKHAILGPTPGCPNLYLVNGSSGHGVMHSPALGLLLSEIIMDGKASSLDVFPLRPSRFAEGKPIAASDRL